MTEIAPIKPVARRREWYDDIPQNTRFHTSFGFTFLAAIIVGFGIWANTALIAGAITGRALYDGRIDPQAALAAIAQARGKAA